MNTATAAKQAQRTPRVQTLASFRDDPRRFRRLIRYLNRFGNRQALAHGGKPYFMPLRSINAMYRANRRGFAQARAAALAKAEGQA
jgi:hypothetical protein